MQVNVNVDRREWAAALDCMAPECQDIYFRQEFHAVHAVNGDGLPCCSIVRDADRVLVIPGLRVEIGGTTCGEPAWDLQTCRTGVAGPVTNAGQDRVFLEDAWSAWRETMAQAGAVAAFFRLHPLVCNERWLPASATVRDNRQVAFVNLSNGHENAWSRADSRHRNMVRKAERGGATVAWNQRHDEFAALYSRAMGRLDADADYRLSAAFFTTLWKLPSAELAIVADSARVLAGAVFLSGPRWAHYFLAARETAAGNQYGNLLIQAGIERAAARELRGLYLGGGRSAAADDDLLRFKRSASPDLLQYRVALVPIDIQRYAGLVADWTARVGAAPTWLLGYRQHEARAHA